MAKSNLTLIVGGAVVLGAVYLLTRNRTQPTYPQLPSQQVATSQLQQWAQTQSTASTILNIIKGLDFNGIMDMWKQIFGSKDNSNDYSGGGADNPYNPYQQYDPYNYSNNGEYYV